MRGRKGKSLRSELHAKNMLITSRTSRPSQTTIFLCLFSKIVGAVWNIYFSLFRMLLGLRLIIRSNWAKALFPYQGLMRQFFRSFVYSPQNQARALLNSSLPGYNSPWQFAKCRVGLQWFIFDGIKMTNLNWIIVLWVQMLSILFD